MLKTRYIVDFDRSGWFHMAADDYIARSINETQYDAVLRFYTWQPPAVSLGCHQKSDVVDLPECHNRGWDVVFRSTGGRALLHRNDLSYSIVFKSASNRFSRLRKLYENASYAICDVMRQIGIETDNISLSPKLKAKLRSDLCLDAKVRGEVSVTGKKITAAAQHVYHDSLLQHGSIQLKGDPADIAEITNLSGEVREAVKRNLRNEACSLDSILAEIPDVEVLIEMIKVSIVDTMMLQVNDDYWNDYEISCIEGMRERFEIASNNIR